VVDEQAFGTISREYIMRGPSRKRFTLMPLIAIAGLSLVVTLPALSATQLHAAKPVTYTTVTVKSGDSLWAIASKRTAADGDVQAMVDTIVAVNHLDGAALNPGQQLQIPE
jgi:LysM repeat protein